MFSRFVRKLTDQPKKEQKHPRSVQDHKPRTATANKGVSLRDFFRERKGLSFMILALLIVALSTQVRSAVFVIVFIAIAALSKLTQILFPPSMPIGIDLVSILLVIMTVTYGPLIGITAALIAYYIGTSLLMLTGRRNDPAVFIIPPVAYALTGMAISLLGYGLPGIGYTSIFVYAGSVTTLFALYYGAGGITAYFSFLGTYIPFHFWFYHAYGVALANIFI